MRTAAWLIAGLLIGMVLGSWSLKLDLRKAKSEITLLQKQMQDSGKKKGQMTGITSMLNISPGSSGSQRKEAPVATADKPESSRAGEHRGSPFRRHRRPDQTNAIANEQNMKAEIETAANLWKTRSEIARDAFVSAENMEKEHAARFDVLMAAMNMRLSNSIRTWVDQVKTNDVITPESGMRMMNDLSGVFVQTYTDLDRELPQWREASDNNFNAMDFVDPFVALPMVEIEGALNEQQFEGNDDLTEDKAERMRSASQQE